jgi:predicted dehydrogenase
MEERPIKIAVVGLNQAGKLFLESALSSSKYQVVVVADKDIEVASRAASYCGAQACDDIRLALSSDHLDAVFIAAPLHVCAEHIRSAMARKINILRVTPPARNYEEIAGFAQVAAKENVIFAVASTNSHRKVFQAFSDNVKKIEAESFSLINSQCGKSFYHEIAERDPKLAGGGIVLYSVYQLIDQIVKSFGLPSQVYALTTSLAPDRQQRLYVTEDTALISLKFSDTLVANITASRSLAADVFTIQAYGKDRTVLLGDNELSICDESQNVIEKLSFSDGEPEAIGRVLGDFAAAVTARDDAEAILKLSKAGDNLDVLAVIDAAYLSARTGMPESPGRIMELSQIATNRYINTAHRSV